MNHECVPERVWRCNDNRFHSNSGIVAAVMRWPTSFKVPSVKLKVVGSDGNFAGGILSGRQLRPVLPPVVFQALRL